MLRIVTDSVSSIPAEMRDEYGIEVVSLYVNRDGVEYEDATMDVDKFYEDIYDMVDNIPTSSQPSQMTFTNLFESAAEKGDEVLGIFMSSVMSGTLNGAVTALTAVQDRYANFKCTLIDSMSNSFDEALPVITAAKARNAGKSLSECVEETIAAIKSSRFLFSPESLTFLQKGGRIGTASAMLGNLMKITPIITVTDGTTTALTKVRSRKKAIDAMMKMFMEDVEKHGLTDVAIHYIGDKTDAVKWAKEKVEPVIGRAVPVIPVTPVIGLHVGPAVGIAYQCKEAILNKLTGDTEPAVYGTN